MPEYGLLVSQLVEGSRILKSSSKVSFRLSAICYLLFRLLYHNL